jgi:hypothetical protein
MVLTYIFLVVTRIIFLRKHLYSSRAEKFGLGTNFIIIPRIFQPGGGRPYGTDFKISQENFI